MKAPLLDTHAWIWWVDGNRKLDTKVIKRLDTLAADDRPYLSGISLWEAATLSALGRLEVEPSFDAWLARAAAPTTVRILPITPEIAMDLARLPGTVRRDPADRIIISTARVHQVPLLTLDRVILGSGLIREWRG